MPLENVEGDICRCRGRSSEIRHFEVAKYAFIVLNNPSRETTVLGGTLSPMTDLGEWAIAAHGMYESHQV
jgi:hypothetical protein